MYLARASHSILFMPGSKARYNRGVILHETCDFLFQVFLFYKKRATFPLVRRFLQKIIQEIGESPLN